MTNLEEESRTMKRTTAIVVLLALALNAPGSSS